MPTVKVRNLKNKEVGDVSLSDAVFGVELNEALIHCGRDELIRQTAARELRRRRPAETFRVRAVSSGSRKEQAGLVSRRLRSPLWKGGGNVHGPQPRDWSYQMPKKMRRGALRSALSERLREGNLIIIDEFGFKDPKTKEFLEAIGTLGLVENKKRAKTLIIDSLDNENLVFRREMFRRRRSRTASD